jgi:hypothetical protein
VLESKTKVELLRSQIMFATPTDNQTIFFQGLALLVVPPNQGLLIRFLLSQPR